MRRQNDEVLIMIFVFFLLIRVFGSLVIMCAFHVLRSLFCVCCWICEYYVYTGVELLADNSAWSPRPITLSSYYARPLSSSSVFARFVDYRRNEAIKDKFEQDSDRTRAQNRAADGADDVNVAQNVNRGSRWYLPSLRGRR